MAILARVRVVGGLKKRVETVVKAISLAVVDNLRKAPADGGTPVDTGWARANWIPSIGAAAQAAVGSRSAVSTAPQDGGVAEVAAGYVLERGAVFITNHVPYIGDLNKGSSPQADAGFVQRAVVAAAKQVIP